MWSPQPAKGIRMPSTFSRNDRVRRYTKRFFAIDHQMIVCHRYTKWLFVVHPQRVPIVAPANRTEDQRTVAIFPWNLEIGILVRLPDDPSEVDLSANQSFHKFCNWIISWMKAYSFGSFRKAITGTRLSWLEPKQVKFDSSEQDRNLKRCFGEMADQVSPNPRNCEQQGNRLQQGSVGLRVPKQETGNRRQWHALRITRGFFKVVACASYDVALDQVPESNEDFSGE
jgi:hypothetical protein